jgi:hypothetical protein
MGCIVAFNYAAWVARYPEFTSVQKQVAQEYFNEATIYHRNDGGGPVPTAPIQTTLLNMMTAHIAARYAQSQGSPSPGAAQDANSLVGRISDATEGSVTVRAEMPTSLSAYQAWLFQTKYGADYWQATIPFRTMRYLPPRNRGGIGAGIGPLWPGMGVRSS